MVQGYSEKKQWLPVGAKGYSTNTDGLNPEFVNEEAALDTQTVSESNTAKEDEREVNDEDPLFAIAKAGTSPKARGLADPTAPSTVSRKVVDMELRWLKDPRELSDRVARLLTAGDVPLAAALVRAAQQEQMECAVAWNHLIEYCLKQKQPKAAFKFYNEMKKRGRKPNSVTYTIMLDGLCKARRDPGLDPVKTALSIYKSISAPNSAVKLNLIHTNAMLNVCSRHNDMDTLWQVAGELPEDGTGSPDCTTYSIILRAISDAAQRDVAGMKPSMEERIIARKAQGIKEAKRIWSDIVFRWGKGQLELDNRLVNAMALVLLEGSTERDCHDVFALINQTTGIPIFAKAPSRDSHNHRASRLQKNSQQRRRIMEDVPFVDEGDRLYRPSEVESKELGEGEEEESFENLFDPVVSQEAAPATKQGGISDGALTPSYIPVGNRELSIILETCLTMTQGIGPGKAYWQHLTLDDTDYKIEPDRGTYHQYLRLLRLGHSSRVALELIRDQMVPAQMTEGRSFRIAFACCLRDRKNINVFKNANEILRLMDTSLVLPFPQALGAYLDMVRILNYNPQLLMSLNGIHGDNERPTGNLSTVGQKLRLNLQITAVETLRPSIAKLDEAMEYGRVSPAPAKSRTAKILDHNYNQNSISGAETLRVLATVRGLIDEILKPENSRLLPKENRTQLKQDSQDLRKYSKPEIIQKYKNAMVTATPKQVLGFQDRQAAEDPFEVD
ncbi:hypothetical protein BBP40_010277 [Aspergillus hancockii]|nr:hypothetical protein BBP40_010277 [Aspergillus hancockii]